MKLPNRSFMAGCATGCLSAIVVPVVLVFGAGWVASSVPSFREAVMHRMQGRMEPPALPQAAQADYAWSLKTRAGKDVPFAQFRGKTVLVHLWQAKCPTCLAELPELIALYEKVAADGVEFVCIASGELDSLEYVLSEYRPPFEVYVEGTPRPSAFTAGSPGNETTPYTWVVSPSGEIVLQRKGAAKWDEPQVVEFIKGIAKQPAPPPIEALTPADVK